MTGLSPLVTALNTQITYYYGILAENRDKYRKKFNKSQLLTAKQPKSGKIQLKSVLIIKLNLIKFSLLCKYTSTRFCAG